MTIPVTSRYAGKALGDFLSTAGSLVEKAVLNKLTSTYLPREVTGEPVRVGTDYVSGQPMYSKPSVTTEVPKAASSTIGKIVTKLGPANIAKLAGATAPLALAAPAMAGYNLLAGQGQQAAGAAPKSYRPPAFASSAYIPGSLPMTNEQMGEAMLDQQRFQHQLQLIQARQDVSMHRGSLQNSGGDIGSILSLGQKIYG